MVYRDERILTRPDKDKVWILSEEAAHPNLFAWDNPWLPSNSGSEIDADNSARIPSFIQMGGNLKDMQTAFAMHSSFTDTLQLDGSDPHAQLQMDCFGIPYAGFPRKFEARFGDGKLNVIWILTGKGEEDRMRTKLTSAYGESIFKNAAWEVFKKWEVLLRKDKPEILVLTPQLAQYYKKEFFKVE
jgi:hypothetical protein